MQIDSGQETGQQLLLDRSHPQRSSWPSRNTSFRRPAREYSRVRRNPILRRPSSAARCLDIASPGTAGAVIDHLRFAPVLLALPPVYALIAAPTAHGVAGLDRMKRRLPGKNYGTAAGELAHFWNLVDTSSIPCGFHGPTELENTRDVFFRCSVSQPKTQTPVIRDGTHQTLILGGLYRRLVSEIEAAFARDAEPGLFAGHRFSAPLITSCNISGDPLGSISEESRGLEFIQQRGVGLWVRGSQTTDEAGSYPILELEPEGLSIRREGGSIRSRDVYRRFRKRS